MLIESDDLREELKHPVWMGKTTPEYEKGWRDACAGVEKCIQHVEDEQRALPRADIEQVRKEQAREEQAERISYAAKMHVENNVIRLEQLDDLFYKVSNPMIDLDTMPLKDVPIDGVVIDKFLDIVYVYVKTPEQVGTDGETLELKQIYSSAGMSGPYTSSYFNRNALVVYTGIRIKEWGNLIEKDSNSTYGDSDTHARRVQTERNGILECEPRGR